MTDYADAIARIAQSDEPRFLWDGGRRRVVFANPAALALLGEASVADAQDRRFAHADPLAAALARARPGEALSADLDGRDVVLSVEAARLKDGRAGLIVAAADAEADPEPGIATLFGEAPVPLAVFGTDGTRILANAEAEALLMPGDLGSALSSPYAAQELIAKIERRGEASAALPVATRLGLRRCRVTGRRVEVAEIDGPALLLRFDDVEDRFEAEIEIVEAEPPPEPEPQPRVVSAPAGAALGEVVAALLDATLAADAEGRVIAMNARAGRLIGESAPGEPLLNMLPPDLKADAAAYLAAKDPRGIERALEDGRETRISKGGGEAVPVRAVFARLATGEVLVQFRDLTAARAQEEALKRAREEAEAASRHKTEFLAKISHELRTPLNAIIGFADVMRSEVLGPLPNEKYRSYVRDIHDSGNLLLSLINDLLDLSKAESGKIELEPDAVEVAPIVQGVLAMLGPQADKFGVTLIPSVAKDMPALVADARSLKQILLNVVGNAIKYGREGGRVEVSASMDAAGAAHLTVRDEGPGMSAEDLARALEPYRRVKGGRKDREGTGLGLPLAKAMTEANKAAFAIESQPGKGTTVRITFPTALVLAG